MLCLRLTNWQLLRLRRLNWHMLRQPRLVGRARHQLMQRTRQRQAQMAHPMRKPMHRRQISPRRQNAAIAMEQTSRRQHAEGRASEQGRQAQCRHRLMQPQAPLSLLTAGSLGLRWQDWQAKVRVVKLQLRESRMQLRRWMPN